MHFQRPILYCAFSNDAEYTLRLFEEEGRISTVLTELDKQGKIEYKHKDKASLGNVYNFFNDYHNRVFVFHYGGHSDSEFLHFHEQSGRSEPLATLIGQQKHLKLVFLNGCANQAQVRALLEKGVPAVIATRESVGDKQAITLAEQFYKALANGKTIRESFDAAESYLKQIHADREFVRERGCRPREESPDRPFPWGLYYENEKVLAWHIGQVEQESKIEKLSKLREASRNRHQKFTSPGGRFQHLDIQQAILAGIRDIAPNKTVRFEENVDLDGERLPLLESVSSLWGSSNPHSLVVGAGGMGKTVSLLRLWERWSLTERGDIPVPIFIQLNEFNNNSEHNFIQNYIRRHYGDLDLDEVLKTSAIGQGGKPQPHVLLLLDGFNEVTASSNELILEINRLRVQEDYPGIQMVLSSRVDIRSTYQWQSFHLLELQPLSDVQIQAYLREIVPSDSRLLEVLRNPMMLSIYATQSELPKRYLEKGLLKEHVTSTGEMLFNVEAIQRIKIEEQFILQPSALLLHRFVLEHLLPYLGWTMQQTGSFFLEETSLLQFLGGVPEHLLQKDFFLVFKDFRKLDQGALKGKEDWELQEELIDQICCQGLAMLVIENNSYRFLHQNFRDYFAARYLQNQIKLALHQKILPEAFRKAPLDFYVRQVLAELEGEHTNKMEWNKTEKKWKWSKSQFFLQNNLVNLLEKCRGIFDNDQLGYTVWNLLTLWKEQRGELSGADLTRLNFGEFSINNVRVSRPYLAANVSEGILSEENLFSFGHSDIVWSMAYSPDGSRIVSGSGDKTIKVWDAQTGLHLLTLEAHFYGISSVAYSLDGSRIISGSGDKTIKVWDAQTGKCLSTLTGHSHDICSVAFSPDGKRIVSGSWDENVKVWDAQTGQCLFTLDGHSNVVNSVAYSPDGSCIISGSWDNTAKIWNAHTGQCLLTLQEHSNRIWSLAFSPDGNRIVTGSWDEGIKVWDAQTGKCLLNLNGHSGGIHSVAYSSDGRRIVSGSYDDTAKVWDAQTGKCLLTLKDSLRETANIAYCSNDNHVAISMENGIQVWDTQIGQCIWKVKSNLKEISSAAYSLDGNRIVTGSKDYNLKVWDAQIGQCLLTLDGHSGGVNSVAYSPDKSHIVSGSWDHSVKVWDAQTGQCSLTLTDHLGTVNSVAYSPDGTRIVSGSVYQPPKVWDAQTGQCLLTLEGHSARVNCVTYSPDGSHIASGSDDQTTKVWDAQTGHRLLTLEGHSDNVNCVTYSPDGSHIVSGSDDQTIKVWNAQTGQCLLTLEGHSARISCAAYSPDGTRIVSRSFDNTKIWDAQTGQCLLTLDVRSARDTSVAYSPDGSRIITASFEIAQIWNAQTGQSLLNMPNSPGLFIQGCDFRNRHSTSNLSYKSIALLRQYGGIFNDEDAENWETLKKNYFDIKF